MSNNVYNFGAGPATLPSSVIEQVKSNLQDFDNGMSIMEISHRSSAFKDYAYQSEASIRKLLNMSDDYAVLFLQGGATFQFSMVPQNLSEWLPNKKYQINGSANYLITGGWSKKAADYAKFHTSVNTVYDSSENSYTSVTDIKDWNINPDVDYFYYCANETVHGLEIHETPDISGPIICDMSSTLCTRPININDFDLIFAGAQKNLGIAGLTIVIVKKELINDKAKHLPPLLRYESHSLDNSMLNTSPVFAWYVAGLVFNWIIAQGGLQSMSKLNQEKSSLLYDFIDSSEFYNNPVNPKYRSWVNIPFTLTSNNLDERFLNEASNEGLMNLKGHRTVGGMRASVYNAMPIEGVKKLIAFMENFETNNIEDV